MRPFSAKRRPDWPEVLAAFIESRMQTPFQWGTHDCVLFAADAVLALTGEDLAAEWRGTYHDEAGADALIAEHGDLYRMMLAIEARRGDVRCPPDLAQRGDTALVEHGNTLAMGVVLGEVVAVPGIDGLEFVERSAIRRAWVT